jgi:hypothetical protein
MYTRPSGETARFGSALPGPAGLGRESIVTVNAAEGLADERSFEHAPTPAPNSAIETTIGRSVGKTFTDAIFGFRME